LSTLNFSSALQQNLPSAVLLLLLVAADSRRWRVLTTAAIATLLLLLVATEPLQVGDTSATADDLD